MRTRRRPGLVRILSAMVAAVVLAGMVAATTMLTAQPARAAPEVWMWPLAPRPEVVRGFVPPESPWGQGHRGVDLLGVEHQAVRAAGAGVVTYAGLLAGRGVVTISHGALETTYEPVTALLAVGVEVRAGEPVGRLTAVQSHCGPRVCLHWGALRDGHYVDPLGLLGSGPPRLLPIGPIQTDGGAATGDRQSAAAPELSGDVVRLAEDPPPDPPAARRAVAPGTPAATEPTDEPSGMRARAASVSTIAAPAAGALAGAITAGIVVRLTGKGSGPSPSRPPPAVPPTTAAVSRRTRGGVVDLDAVRQRLRGAA